MYSVDGHAKMLADRTRVAAYREALRRTVKPGAVVVDIGTGTGVFAAAACAAGARRVYAIEPGEVIHVARDLAAANGYADRVEFLQAESTRVTLPERADLVVSDLRGVLPPFGQHLVSVIDARARFLAPGGRLVPQRDRLWAAVVSAPDLYRRLTSPWDDAACGLDLSELRRLTTHTWHKARIDPAHLLTDAQCWAELDYTTLDGPDVRGRAAWVVPRAATAHGIGLWFDATLAEDVGFSGAPGPGERIYGQAFFPWPEPLDLAAGDAVEVDVRAALTGADYEWRWITTVTGGASSGRVKAEFRQSTLASLPLSAAFLHKTAADHVCSISEEGELVRFVLERMDGTRPQAAIARELAERFRARFESPDQARIFVSAVAVRYAR
jgi:protein arginine N-methyltransferase 1